MSRECLDFGELNPAEVDVKIGGREYVLREASGDAACKYRNALLKATKLGPNGKPQSLDGVADSEPLLVSLCLFEKYRSGDEIKERPAILPQVRGWPSRVQKTLFDRAKKMSGLDESEKTKEQIQEQIKELRKKLEELDGAEEGKEGEEKPDRIESTESTGDYSSTAGGSATSTAGGQAKNGSVPMTDGSS